MRKIRDLLTSMSFAIVLLVLLAACCAFGSFITQGQTYEWYAGAYGERAAVLIMALYLDDIYHSWWFFALGGFLCLDLLLCDLVRLPSLIRRTKKAIDPQSILRSPVTASLSHVADPAPVFSALHMPEPKAFGQDGVSGLFSVKNRAGLWGAWVCHLGILLLILGFGLGQMTHMEYTVYGVPGDEKPIGDTGLTLSIDDFRIDRREDGTARQYTASITVSGKNAAAQSGKASVNHPAALHGLKIYQNSTGWAAAVTVSRDGETLQEKVLCAGEYMPIQALPELSVFFNAFYPDYAPAENEALEGHAYLYTLYYRGQIAGMNILLPGEVITVDDYTIRFSDPQEYTLLQVKQDRFTSLALMGGLIVLIGLLLAFYCQPRTLWALSGQDGLWNVYGFSPKGGALFAEQLHSAQEATPKLQKEE